MDETKVIESTTTVESMDTDLVPTASVYDLEPCEEAESSGGNLVYVLGGMAIGAAVCGIVGLVHRRVQKKKAMKAAAEAEVFEDDDFDEADFTEVESEDPEKKDSEDKKSKKK